MFNIYIWGVLAALSVGAYCDMSTKDVYEMLSNRMHFEMELFRDDLESLQSRMESLDEVVQDLQEDNDETGNALEPDPVKSVRDDKTLKRLDVLYSALASEKLFVRDLEKRLNTQQQESRKETNHSLALTSPAHKPKTPENFLLLADSLYRKLYRMDMDTETYVKIPVTDVKNPIAIAYDPVEERIYWTDVLLKQIRSSTIEGEDEILVKQLNQISVPDGLAVDPVSRLLFYTDAGNNDIRLMKVDGFDEKVVVNSDLDQPRTIVLDCLKGIMYWTDWGTNAKIETASYDGWNRKVLVDSGIVWPNGLALDVQAGKLYWADSSTHRIESINVDGSNRQLLRHEVTTSRRLLAGVVSGRYYGLALYNGSLIYTDWSKSVPMRMSIGDSYVAPVGPPVFGRLNGIHIQQKGHGVAETNSCSKENGGCKYICVPTGIGYSKCLCPDGITCS